MAKGKMPVRMCIACREMKPKKEMLRIVKTADGEIFPDPTGKAAGRGAYICKSTACLVKARKAHRLEASFSMKIEDAVYDALEEKLSRENRD